MKVFVTSDDKLVKNMFIEKGYEVVPHFSQHFDIICFTGGADINPFLYGERPLSETTFSTRRDNLEIRYWKATTSDVPKVGICRGAQLGNVLCGGSLWQDVDNHNNGKHLVKDLTFPQRSARDRYLPVSSVHHQMCIPTNDARVLAKASVSTKLDGDGISKRYGYQTNLNNWDDVEAFYYSNFNFLGVQFHPEYTGFDRCKSYFWDLFDETLFKHLAPGTGETGEGLSNMF